MFDPAGPCSASTPASRAAATASSVATAGRLRPGRLRRDPHTVDRAARPALALLEAELEDLVAELRPSALAVERVLFQVNTVRTAMSVGQASGLALAVAGAGRGSRSSSTAPTR